jgi:hypothetical protein
MNRKEQHLTVQQEAHNLFIQKNKDYGDAFANYGTIGVIVRMGDKIHRLVNITKNGINLIQTESLRDTLIDLHNYAAMAIMLLDEKPKKLTVEIPKSPPPPPNNANGWTTLTDA